MAVSWIIVAIMAWSTFLSPQAPTGRYALATDTAGIVRMDTKTGQMERCNSQLECKTQEAVPQLTSNQVAAHVGAVD